MAASPVVNAPETGSLVASPSVLQNTDGDRDRQLLLVKPIRAFRMHEL
jgi:hypothetical protein